MGISELLAFTSLSDLDSSPQTVWLVSASADTWASPDLPLSQFLLSDYHLEAALRAWG